MCCDGTIFADLKLQPEDNARHLNSLGREMHLPGGHALVLRRKICQPCAGFDGRSCLIYANRPEYCRRFECGVLKEVKAGTMARRTARNRICAARKLVAQVIALLRELGDQDETLALPARVRRCREGLEKNGLSGAQAETYSEFTLAFHALTLVLSESFYPSRCL